jgi:hypothetical protein
MVHHIALYQLKVEATPELLDEMMLKARTMLLRVPEVLSIKCGKNVNPDSPHSFFYAIDFDNLEKLEVFHQHPSFVKFRQDVITPLTKDCLTLNYEMEPGKDTRYS